MVDEQHSLLVEIPENLIQDNQQEHIMTYLNNHTNLRRLKT